MAQNNVWTFPPNYSIGLGTPSPLPTPGGYAPGDPSQHNYILGPVKGSNNSMQDNNGNLLFFIESGKIYDSEGYYIADVGGSNVETGIVPVPDNCEQYYIITNYRPNLFSYILYPNYKILDLSVANPISLRKGAIIDVTTGVADPYNTGIDLTLNVNPVWNSAANKNVFMGTTTLRADNTRFLFISSGVNVYRYKISSNGISFDNYSFPLSAAISAGGEFHSELEIVEINNGSSSKYRIAIPQRTDDAAFYVRIIDLDINGNVISGTEKSIDLIAQPFTDGTPYIKGLEFSPNGKYLYLTHINNTSSPFNNFPFKIFDVDNNNYVTVTNPNLIADIHSFRFSLIELGKDGKLYLANDHYMATITNPDNPTSLVWNGTAFPLNYALSKGTLVDDNPSGPLDSALLLYLLPDQIDGMNYTSYLNTGESCCMAFNSYDISSANHTNEYSTSATWTDGNNPIGIVGNETSPIYIKDNLIIKSGTYITINDMELHFAPNVQLIIENGAKLFLHNSTLTADIRCSPEAMWHGIEIWGTGTNTFQPLVSGSLISSNSTITNALEAIANYKHNLSTIGKPIIGSAVYGTVGGIIQLNGVTLKDNQYDVYMRPFQAVLPPPNANAINDRSYFIKTNFITTDQLNNPNLTPKFHVILNQVNGVRFTGCKFENSAPNLTYLPFKRGVGINATNSLFSVTDSPNNTSEFTNLYRGIDARSWNPLKTAKITNTAFYNIWRGIFLRTMNVADVSNNTFDVGSNMGFGVFDDNVSYGLFLSNCTGYKVENNAFTTTFNGHLGVGIHNSGTATNEIYKNTFSQLVIGTQAQNINGNNNVSNILQTGLEFKCNTYDNIEEYDILVSSGIVKPYQGSCNDVESPANNQFSYTTQYGDYWLENTPATTIQSTYIYSPSTASNNLAPRNGYFNSLNTAKQECLLLPTFNETNSCPVRTVIGNGGVGPIKNIKTLEEINLVNLGKLLDNNNTTYLTGIITQQPAMNNDQLKSELTAARPLSSNILLTLINSNTSHETLKTILIQNAPLGNNVLFALINKTPTISPKILKEILEMNAPLAEFVIDELNTVGIPSETMNEIMENQNNQPLAPSQTQLIESEMTVIGAEISRLNNDIIRILLFDDIIDEGFHEVVDFINSTPLTNSDEQLLVNALMANQEFNGAQQALVQLQSNPINLDFYKLNNTLIACQAYPEKEAIIATNLSLQQPINAVAAATTNYQEVTAAKTLREQAGLDSDYVELVEIVIHQYGRTANNNENGNQPSNRAGIVYVLKINVFPNPTKDQFTLTHNLFLDNGIITLDVFDLMGRNLMVKQINTTETVVDTRALATGVYFYTITQNGATIKTDKLVIK